MRVPIDIETTPMRIYGAMISQHALPEGARVRVTFKRRVGLYPKGKYKGIITASGESIYSGLPFVRILVTHAPTRMRWLLGRPMYVAQSLVVLLPTYRK